MNSNVPGRQRAREIDALVDHLDPLDAEAVRKAWDFAETLYGAARLPTGEAIVEHALGTVRILDAVRADAPARAAGFLFSAAERLTKAEEQLNRDDCYELFLPVANDSKPHESAAVIYEVT